MTAKPNILLITTDQQHYDTIGVNNPAIRTPALDRLAAEGALFTRAYCNNPVCSPSRASILTGMYPAWHHCWTIGVKLPDDVPTVNRELEEAGYDTALVGKAHFEPTAPVPGHPSIERRELLRDVDFWRTFNGPWYGFDHVEIARNHGDGWLVGGHWAAWMEDKGLTNWREYTENPEDSGERGRPGWYWHGPNRRRHTWELPQEYHYTTWTAERTIAAIERSRASGRPFFVWSSYQDPHIPYLAPRPWSTMYRADDMTVGALQEGEFDLMPPHFAMTQDPDAEWSVYLDGSEARSNHGFHDHRYDPEELRRDKAVYYGMISFIDDRIGTVLTYLDAQGLTDDTLVIFTTDHGHFMGEHGLIAKGAFHYDDLLRVPFIVRWPKRIPGGRTVEALQSLIDIPETMLDAAGVDVPGRMQGVSQLDVWTGEREGARDNVIVENRHQPATVHLRTFVTDRYKLTVYRDAPYGELFDLEDDPREVHNRWDDPAYASTKSDLMLQFLNAELQREPTRMPRVSGS